MVYSREKKLLFLHVPKTGGSSILLTLRRRLGVVLEEAICTTDTPLGPPCCSLVDFEASGIRPEEHFSFAFVRDPYSRAVSLYHHIRSRRYRNGHWLSFPSFDRFCRDLEDVHGRYSDLRYRRGADIARIGSMCSGKWPDNLGDTPCLSRYWWMSLPMSEFLDKPLDFIGRFESLQRDFGEVCSRANLPPTRLCHTGKSRLLKVKSCGAHYSTTGRRIVEKVYRRDFERFGYPAGCPDEPGGAPEGNAQ